MTFTIHFGWWLLPAIFTLSAFTWAFWVDRDNRPSGDYSAIGSSMATAMVHGIALVVSLAAWLVWSLWA